MRYLPGQLRTLPQNNYLITKRENSIFARERPKRRYFKRFVKKVSPSVKRRNITCLLYDAQDPTSLLCYSCQKCLTQL